MVKKKKKIMSPVVYSLILYIFYFIFFPYSTEKELSLKPLRVHFLEEETNFSPHPDQYGHYSFRVNNIFGYLDEEGDITYKEGILYDVALSDHGYINFSSIQDENQSLVLMDTHGNYRQSYSLPGYPFFTNNGERLFIIKTDATGIREVSFEGEELWQAKFASLITGFSTNDEYALAGFLNGDIKLFNRNGESLYNYTPGDSRLSVVYGTAISRNSKTIATLYGIDPYSLLFFRKGRANYQHPVKIKITGGVRRPGFIHYSHDDRYLVFESEQNLHTMDVKSIKTDSLPVQGRLRCVSLHTENQMIAASFDKQDLYHHSLLCLYKPGNRIFVKKQCAITINFLRFIGDRLIVGFDDILLIFNIREL